MAFGDEQIDGYADGEEPMVFHHKRGEYREKEAKQYSDLATNQNQPKKGLFRVLVNTRGNRIMFFTMLFCFALVLIIGLLSDNPNECTYDSVPCELSAFSFEDQVFASLKLSTAEKNKGTAIHSFHAEFVFYDSDGNEVDRLTADKVFDSAGSEDFIRCSHTDYDIKKVDCWISCESAEERKKITCKVQQR